MPVADKKIFQLLERTSRQYNQPAFIATDPISIPHRYVLLQDREISGFWTAILSWGNRSTIIQKATTLFHMMDDSPFAFITQHSEQELKKFLAFKHRTFNATDTLYFIHFLKHFYARHTSLEEAFLFPGCEQEKTVENMLNQFHTLFFQLPEAPHRTKKHVACPAMGSTCKRINMFLRWMVRSDDMGVDFGCWHRIRPDQLICPLDVHVERVARQLGLLRRKQVDWKAALELTESLRTYDPGDPVKYDFSLFGMGVMQKMA